jgi:peptidoglycan/xylan/chitin deacetylase (PgdA/CDA1 family)
MVNIFCTEITPRIEYSFRLVFTTLLNEEIALFTQTDEYLHSTGIKVNYSTDTGLPGLHVVPVTLLFEQHLQIQFPEVIEWEGLPALYPTNGKHLPFDVFAASFFLVTRYEEYLPSKRDRHQRFQPRHSFASVKNFLERPLVNHWALHLAEKIEVQNPGFYFTRSRFTYIPTIDIDNAWAFRNKGFIRNSASFLRDVFHRRWKLISRRYASMYRLKKDPYDNYDFIFETVKKYGFQSVFFFLLCNKGKHDRSLSHRNRPFQNLIKKVAENSEIGLHPSYTSSSHPLQLKRELNRLSAICGKEITRSRQHYLKLSFPKTYTQLIRRNIKEDYTMGYPSRPGFRASICTPFPFFDLNENQPTELMIFPFQVMDVTLRDYRSFRTAEASAKIQKLMAEVHSVGGTFISLWHNESLSDEGHWKDWRDVYLKMTRLAWDYKQKS